MSNANMNTLPGTTLRNGTLDGLVDLLRRQSDVKYDVVVASNRLRYENGLLHVTGGAARFDDDGVSEADAVLSPTDIFESGLCSKLELPRAYVRKMRAEAGHGTEDRRQLMASLLDVNVNTWLADQAGKNVMVRGFRTDDPDDVGVARAFLSDQFNAYDHIDVLMAAIDGVNQTGVHAEIHSANLSERNMRVTFTSPEITAMAPILLNNYRSPFGGGSGRDLPIIQAGFEIRNSETGGGALEAAPWALVLICSNGMKRNMDLIRAVHLGGKLEEGPVRWSEDTRRKSIELVTARVRDAVSTFLDADYLARWVDDIEQKAGAPVDDALGTIERVAKVHLFSDSEQAHILDCFIKSGSLTAGGVMQAVTAAAQNLDDPDRAAEFESMAMDVLATAAA